MSPPALNRLFVNLTASMGAVLGSLYAATVRSRQSVADRQERCLFSSHEVIKRR